MREAVIVAAKGIPIGKAYRGAFNNTYGGGATDRLSVPQSDALAHQDSAAAGDSETS
jgi:hypothetical protein